MNSDRCARILEENWNRFPCPDPVVVVFELLTGIQAGFCECHRADGERHAAVRGWKPVERPQAVSA